MMVESTQSYYKARAAEWAASLDVPSYITKSLHAIDNEKRLLNTCSFFPDATRMYTVMYEVLVRDHIDFVIRSGRHCFQQAMEALQVGRRVVASSLSFSPGSQEDQLKDTFRVFQQDPVVLREMADVMKDRLLRDGQNIVARRKDAADKKENGHLFIQDLIRLHDRFSRLVTREFQSSSVFSTAMTVRPSPPPRGSGFFG